MLLEVIRSIPVIIRTYPYPDHQINAAFAEFFNSDLVIPFMIDPVAAVDQLSYHTARFVDILGVGNRNDQINAPFLTHKVICDVIGGKAGVRDQDLLVIIGSESGVHHVDFNDNALQTLCFEIVADLELLVEYNERTACHIGKAVLESQTDSDCRRADRCDQRRYIEAQYMQHSDEQDDSQGSMDGRIQKTDDGRIHLCAPESLDHTLADDGDEPPSR